MSGRARALRLSGALQRHRSCRPECAPSREAGCMTSPPAARPHRLLAAPSLRSPWLPRAHVAHPTPCKNTPIGECRPRAGQGERKDSRLLGCFLKHCEIVQRLVAQIPWGHVIHLMDKVTDKSKRLWSFFVHVCALDAAFRLDSLTVSTSFKEARIRQTASDEFRLRLRRRHNSSAEAECRNYAEFDI